MIRRGRTILILSLTMMASAVMAKEKVVRTKIESWHMASSTYLPDTIAALQDTTHLNWPMRDMQTDYSMNSAFSGNAKVAPLESRLFFDRRHQSDDPFAQAYNPYFYSAQDVRFFRSTTPFSTISYDRTFLNGHEDNDIRFLFTGNIGRRTNLGTMMNYLNANGHYLNQAGKLYNGQVWGSYNGDHYSVHGALTWAQLSHYNNGGITNAGDLGGSLQTGDIPVNLEAMTGFRYLNGFLQQSYSITTPREHHDSIQVVEEGQKVWKDSVRVEHVPVMTFAYVFETNNSNRRYLEKQAKQDFYPETYRNQVSTRDSSDVLTIRNSLSATFCEEFNRLMHFGATVYATNECQRHLFAGDIVSAEDSLRADSLFRYQWTNNTFVGGSIYKNQGKWIRYQAGGEVCVVGYKLGEFNVQGNVRAYLPFKRDSLFLEARAHVKNETPSLYVQHYASNHYCWDNSFSKTYRYGVGGTVSYTNPWVKPSATVLFEDLQRYIYWDETGKPQQHDGHIQVLSADVRCDITTPWINLENHVVYQLSSRQDLLALPTITMYHNLYYHGTWFHALDAQMGIDLSMFTSYYSPILNPATGQFCTQSTTRIGNYPLMSAYVNFFVRSLHLRFFAQYNHINRLFMQQNINYYAMPTYPYNRDVFRAGLAWHFYN